MTDKEQAALEAEIQSLYRKTATEQPSTSLDNDILALAKEQASKQQVKTQTSQSFWRQQRWPLASAASVLVVVTLFMINPAMQNSDVLEQQQPMMMSTPEQPQMMRAMPEPAAKTDEAVQTSQGSLPTENRERLVQSTELSADVGLVSALDNVAGLIEAKQIKQADELLKQTVKQWPEIIDESHPQHARYLSLQHALMSGH